MGHNVGDAAARSVEKSKKVEARAARTPEQRIKDIRMNAEGILSVPNTEVVFLLGEYDKTSTDLRLAHEISKARDVLAVELKATQEALSAANIRIVELDQVAFNLAQKANVGMSETVELDGQKVRVSAEPLPRDPKISG